MRHSNVEEKVILTGNSISVLDLKSKIVELKNLKCHWDFDLKVTDSKDKGKQVHSLSICLAHSSFFLSLSLSLSLPTEYTSDDDLITKNTKVIVSRVPAKNGLGLRRRMANRSYHLNSVENTTGDIVLPLREVENPEVDEEDVTALLLESYMNEKPLTATKGYCQMDRMQSKNKRPTSAFRPMTVRGNPCQNPNVKAPNASVDDRTYYIKGIPKDGQSGPKVTACSLQRDEQTRLSVDIDTKEIPAYLLCPLTNKLLREAVTLPCCNAMVNETAASQRLLLEGLKCPLCGAKEISPESVSLEPSSTLLYVIVCLLTKCSFSLSFSFLLCFYILVLKLRCCCFIGYSPPLFASSSAFVSSAFLVLSIFDYLKLVGCTSRYTR
jgi:hypothetical protein